MNSGGRSQFGQFSNPQGGGGGGHYGLGSIYMASMDTGGYQPMSGFQQHSHQQQHSQAGPPGQAQSQNNRISPAPLPTSGGGGGGGVVMNSSSMKSQGGVGHPSMTHQHQVMQGAHNQQGYSHMNHHHSAVMGHHQHGPVGKPSAYNQSAMATQSQVSYLQGFNG
jgi:hypothetical protein